MNNLSKMILVAFMVFIASISFSKTITLTEKNTLLLRDKVNYDSITKIQLEALKKSLILQKNEPLYLILDTPGGSIFAGLDLITTLKSLPNPVHTITLFAASMGYQLVQNLGIRYVTKTSVLMSHRASLGLRTSYIDEVETYTKFIREVVDYLDIIAAKRVKLSLNRYKKLILNEYWVIGKSSIDNNHADQLINISCDKNLINNTYSNRMRVLGTTLEFVYSKCPLIRYPIKIKFNGKYNKIKINHELDQYFKNKYKYLQKLKK